MRRWIAALAMLLPASAAAQTYADADHEKFELIVTSPEFAGVKPRAARFAPESRESSQSVTISHLNQEWMWIQAPAGDLRVDHHYTSRSITFRPFDWERTLTAQSEFKDRQLTLEPGTTSYDRGAAKGGIRLFRYSPPAGQRSCAVFFFDHAARVQAHRINGFFCMAPGKSLDIGTATRIVDGIGLRKGEMVPVAGAPAPAQSAPAATAPSAVGGNAADRLRALKDLFDQKLISPAEYEQKRKAILDGL